MNKQENPNEKASDVIEDLTVNETEATNVKGGPFGFGVEREMKESG